MPHSRNSWLTLVLLVLVLSHASAQSDEFLPEIDTYYKLNPDLRIWFQAKQTREGGDPASAEIGPSLDFYLKPWIKLKDATAFDLDDSKARPIIFSVGYRYLPAAGGPSQQRFRANHHFQLSHEGQVPAVGQKPGRPRLEKRRLFLALSQPGAD